MSSETRNDRIFNFINTTILIILLLIVFLPLLFVVVASISDPILVNQGRVWFVPKGITFEGYKRVFQNAEIWTGYKNTIIYTLLGTVINLFLTFTAAYPLTRKDLVGKKAIMFILVFTMYFNGGIIPTYLVVKNLGMTNTMWSLIIPNAIAVWNLILVKTYISTEIPVEVQEAAVIDGASNIRMFFSIIVPLSAPIIAVMALFYGVGHWNEYFNALIYITDRKIYPLQMFLREILVQAQMSDSMKMSGGLIEGMAKQAELSQIIKYAVIIVSTLPILSIYPFLQKYFIKGMMVGSVKG